MSLKKFQTRKIVADLIATRLFQRSFHFMFAVHQPETHDVGVGPNGFGGIMSRTYAIRGGAGSGVKVGKRDPVSKSHRRVIARKGRALALVVSLVTVAFVTMAGASVMRNRDASSSTTLHQHSSAQSGGWIVPADEVSAPAVPTPGGRSTWRGCFQCGDVFFVHRLCCRGWRRQSQRNRGNIIRRRNVVERRVGRDRTTRV